MSFDRRMWVFDVPAQEFAAEISHGLPFIIYLNLFAIGLDYSNSIYLFESFINSNIYTQNEGLSLIHNYL